MIWLLSFVGVLLLLGFATFIHDRYSAFRDREALAQLSRDAQSIPPPPNTPTLETSAVIDTTPKQDTCLVIGCKALPAKPKPRIVRDDSILDLMRRAFGAPARFRIGSPLEDAKPVFCEGHAVVARQRTLIFLAEIELKRLAGLEEMEKSVVEFETTELLKRLRDGK